MMKITRKSMFTGVERTLELDVTQEELDAWQRGAKAQNAFPRLTAGQREFIMTGVIDEEWEAEFGSGKG